MDSDTLYLDMLLEKCPRLRLLYVQSFCPQNPFIQGKMKVMSDVGQVSSWGGRYPLTAIRLPPSSGTVWLWVLANCPFVKRIFIEKMDMDLTEDEMNQAITQIMFRRARYDRLGNVRELGISLIEDWSLRTVKKLVSQLFTKIKIIQIMPTCYHLTDFLGFIFKTCPNIKSLKVYASLNSTCREVYIPPSILDVPHLEQVDLMNCTIDPEVAHQLKRDKFHIRLNIQWKLRVSTRWLPFDYEPFTTESDPEFDGPLMRHVGYDCNIWDAGQ